MLGVNQQTDFCALARLTGSGSKLYYQTFRQQKSRTLVFKIFLPFHSFHVTSLHLYPLKISENFTFKGSRVLEGNQWHETSENGLKYYDAYYRVWKSVLPSGCFKGFCYTIAIVTKVYKFEGKKVTHSLDFASRDLKTNLKLLLEQSFVEEITFTRVMQNRVLFLH